MSTPELAALGIRSVAEQFTAFRDETDRFYIRHGSEAVPIGSTQCKDIIRTRALQMSGRTISQDNIEQVCSILRESARALPALAVARRIHKESDAIFIDLGNADRECIKVTTQDISIVSCIEVNAVFIRDGSYGELPRPELPDESQGIEAAARKALAALKPAFLGVPNKDWIPLASALVERMRPDSPDPILVANGLAGSGKTTVAARWIMLSDPFKGDPPSVAADVKAVYSAMQRRRSLLLDNVGKLDAEMENMLCVSALGGQLAVKELYVTVGTQDLRLKSAWVVTSIGMPIRQDDTHSRSLIIRITAPSGGQKRSDANMRAEFAAEHPAAFGASLWFLRERMRYVARSGPQSSADRMVDWEITGEAISQALGKPPGAYARLRAQTRANQALDWLESEIHFAAPFLAMLADLSKGAQPAAALPSQQTIYQKKPWVGNIGGRVTIAATAEGIRDKMLLSDTPQRVRNKLAGIQGPLIKAGYTVEQHDTHGGRKHYWVFGLPV